MARVIIYLPDSLADDARGLGLDISAITQDAVRRALAARRSDTWLDQVLELKGPEVDVAAVLAAVRDARDDIERGRD